MSERNKENTFSLCSPYNATSPIANMRSLEPLEAFSNQRVSKSETINRCMKKGGLREKGYCKKFFKDKPLLSVITVVLNGAECLERTILSIINQTYDNTEYLIIDGGSSDNTLELIMKYENQIDYWVSGPDEGIFDAMNKGIDLATGTWLNFVNAGDQYISKNTLADAITRLDDEGSCYGFGYQEKLCIGGNTYIRKRTPSPIQYNMPTCHNAIFFPINKNIRYNARYRVCADFGYYREYMRQGYAFKVSATPVIVWTRGGFSDENKFKNICDRIRININYGVKPDLIKFVWCFLKQFAGLVLMTIIPQKLLNILRKLIGSEYFEIDRDDQTIFFNHLESNLLDKNSCKTSSKCFQSQIPPEKPEA